LVALVIDLGHLHQEEQGDSILQVMLSLQRWTVFAWGQDRYGELLPLLARPFRNPFVNMLVQGWLGVFAGLAPFFLLSRYMLRDKIWAAPAALASASLLVCTPAWVRLDWFAAQPYGTSLTLAVGALLILESTGGRQRRTGRLLVALLLMLLASWVNFSVWVLLIPLVLLRSLGGSERAGHLLERTPGAGDQASGLLWRWKDRTVIYSIGLLVLGAVWGRLILRFVKDMGGRTVTRLMPVRQWPGAWAKLAASIWNMALLRPYFLRFAAVSAVGAILLLAVPALRKSWRQTLAVCVALGGAALVQFLLAGASVWAKMNVYFPRYAYPSLVLVSIALGTLAAAPLRALPNGFWRYSAPAGALLLVTLAIYSYGIPSPATARKDIDEKFGGATPEILAAHANLIVGTYWKVWPAVFHASLVLYEQGSHQRIYGLTDRGVGAQKRWSRIPLDKMRAAMFVGDEDRAGFWLTAYGLPLTVVEHRKGIEILAYRPAARAAQ
jgi:hypothetical protein